MDAMEVSGQSGERLEMASSYGEEIKTLFIKKRSDDPKDLMVCGWPWLFHFRCDSSVIFCVIYAYHEGLRVQKVNGVDLKDGGT